MSGLCDRIYLSERHLRRVFKEGIGIAPKDWLRQERMVAARSLLREGSPIKEVAIDLGFTTARMFSRDFQ
jgi:transcriptional regulator GlxA family with amidase domain